MPFLVVEVREKKTQEFSERLAAQIEARLWKLKYEESRFTPVHGLLLQLLLRYSGPKDFSSLLQGR